MRCVCLSFSRSSRAAHTLKPPLQKHTQKTNRADIGAAPAAPKLAAGLTYAPDVRDMLTSWNYVSGWVLVLLAFVAYPFAMGWPRKAAWCKNTAAGRLLNQQGAFWMTHHMLIVVFIPILILHSISFTPGVPLSAARVLGMNKMLWYFGALVSCVVCCVLCVVCCVGGCVGRGDCLAPACSVVAAARAGRHAAAEQKPERKKTHARAGPLFLSPPPYSKTQKISHPDHHLRRRAHPARRARVAPRAALPREHHGRRRARAHHAVRVFARVLLRVCVFAGGFAEGDVFWCACRVRATRGVFLF